MRGIERDEGGVIRKEGEQGRMRNGKEMERKMVRGRDAVYEGWDSKRGKRIGIWGGGDRREIDGSSCSWFLVVGLQTAAFSGANIGVWLRCMHWVQNVT